MKKLITGVIFFCTLILSNTAFAILSMELTQGVAGAIPIAIVPFGNADAAQQNISNIIAADLQNSGRFKVYGKDTISQYPTSAGGISADYFRKLGTDSVVVGKVTALGGDRYDVSFELADMYQKGGNSVV